MPRLTESLPKYRRHISGQAVVTLDGHDFYLGPWNSKPSKQEYDRLVGEWVANGHRLPQTVMDLAISEPIVAYWKFAKAYYQKNGQPTGIRVALRILRKLYGRTRIQSPCPSRRRLCSAAWEWSDCSSWATAVAKRRPRSRLRSVPVRRSGRLRFIAQYVCHQIAQFARSMYQADWHRRQFERFT